MGNKKSNYKKFSTTWKTNPHKTRGLKLYIEKNDELNEFCQRYLTCGRELLLLLDDDRKNGTIDIAHTYVAGKRKGEIITLDVEHLTYPTALRKKYQDILLKYGIANSGQQESITTLVTRVLKGFKNRNNKNLKRCASFKNNAAIQWKNFRWSLNTKDHIISSKLHNNIKFATQFTCEEGIERQLGDIKKKSWGGNLIPCDNKYVLVLKVDKEFKWLYTPLQPLGIDINKQADCFITTSDEITLNGITSRMFSMDRKGLKIITGIRVLQDQVKDYDKISRRNRINKQIRIKKNHKKLAKHILHKYVNEIIQYAITHKLLLCIDDVTTGAKNGTFGQDKLVRQLVQECEDRRIPFVLVPTPYTTRRCSSCGHVKESSVVGKKYVCEVCMYTDQTDLNASENICEYGWYIWNEGITRFFETHPSYGYKYPAVNNKINVA